jgi:hypothetical protein
MEWLDANPLPRIGLPPPLADRGFAVTSLDALAQWGQQTRKRYQIE